MAVRFKMNATEIKSTGNEEDEEVEGGINLKLKQKRILFPFNIFGVIWTERGLEQPPKEIEELGVIYGINEQSSVEFFLRVTTQKRRRQR